MSGSRSAPSSASRRRQGPQGKFEGGVWYCGCDPPQEAAFLQVRKENKNKGRFFFTCPKPRESQCGFYLWQDDANAREKETLQQKSVFGTNSGMGGNKQGISSGHATNNNPVTSHIAWGGGETSRGETPQSEAASNIFYSPRSSVFPTPGPGRGMFRGIPRAPNAGWSSGDDSDVARDEQYPATPAPKRKRSEAEAQVGAGAGAELSDVDSDEARMLVEAADRSERQHRQNSGQESRTSSQTLSQLSDAPPVSTPSAGRGNTHAGLGFGFGIGGLPTPQSGNSFTSNTSLSEPGAKRLRTVDGAAAAAAVPSTPTPARNRNALAGTGAQPSRDGNDHAEDDADITTAILNLLKPEPISPAARRAVRDTLNLHATRARGVQLGRDSVREKLKQREGQVAALQARVVALENERAMRRRVLRRAASELDALCEGEGEGEGDGGVNE